MSVGGCSWIQRNAAHPHPLIYSQDNWSCVFNAAVLFEFLLSHHVTDVSTARSPRLASPQHASPRLASLHEKYSFLRLLSPTKKIEKMIWKSFLSSHKKEFAVLNEKHIWERMYLLSEVVEIWLLCENVTEDEPPFIASVESSWNQSTNSSRIQRAPINQAHNCLVFHSLAAFGSFFFFCRRRRVFMAQYKSCKFLFHGGKYPSQLTWYYTIC